MPLYTTKASLPEIKIYVLDNYGSVHGEFSSLLDLSIILSSPPSFNSFPPKIERKTFIGILGDKEKIPKYCPNHLNIFISTKNITKETYLDIEGTINSFSTKLNKLSFVFTDEAFYYFVDRFSADPVKGNKELTHVLDIFSSTKSKINLSILLKLWEVGMSYSYLPYIGTEKGTSILTELKDSEIWPLINGDFPLIYKYSMSKKAPIIWHFFYSNMIGREITKAILIATDLLFKHRYLIDKTDPNNWKLKEKIYE